MWPQNNSADEASGACRRFPFGMCRASTTNYSTQGSSELLKETSSRKTHGNHNNNSEGPGSDT
jgi:hypothetical protein